MSKVTIAYEDIAVGAAEAATPSAADIQSFCTAADILADGKAPKAATLEQDYWRLDGTWPLFPETPAESKFGIWSNAMTGSDKAFTVPQTVVIVLSSQFSGTGITVYFDEHGPTWCTDMTVAWYRDNILLSSVDYAPTGPEYFCKNTVTSYNKIVLTFRAMSAAGRYLKLSRLKFGRTKVFEPREYKDLSMYQGISLIADTTESNSLAVTLRNDLEDIDFLFQSKQKLTVKEDESLIGVWYIDTHDQVGSKSYDITGIDLIELSGRLPDHMGGVYDGITAEALFAEIYGDAIPYVLDDRLKPVQLYGYLPRATPKDNAHQAAFALGAVLDDSRHDCIYIAPAEAGAATDSFTGARAYDKGKVHTESMITRVDLTVHRYAPGTESIQLYSQALSGTETICFDEPICSLAISGGTLGAHNANYAVISGTGGTVSLNGVKYSHTTKVISRSNPLKTAGDADNPRIIEDMTLVSDANGAALLDELYNYYLRVRTVSGKVVTGENYPGQRVQMETIVGDIVTGSIINMDWHISAKQAADVDVLSDV